MMSEASTERTPGRRPLTRHTATGTYVLVHSDTAISVKAVPGDNRAVIIFGTGFGSEPVRLSLHAPDLDRLHAVIHDAFAQLDRPHTFAVEEAPEAYAAGWDAALSFVQTSTGDPVPTTTPAAPIGVR